MYFPNYAAKSVSHSLPLPVTILSPPPLPLPCKTPAFSVNPSIRLQVSTNLFNTPLSVCLPSTLLFLVYQSIHVFVFLSLNQCLSRSHFPSPSLSPSLSFFSLSLSYFPLSLSLYPQQLPRFYFSIRVSHLGDL